MALQLIATTRLGAAHRRAVRVVLMLGALGYVAATAAADPDPHSLFLTSDQCIACHSNLLAADGQDVSIGYHWRASMMANSARDPYWQAGVRRESIDHPTAAKAIEDECSICHMPMAHFEAKEANESNEVFSRRGDPVAMDGVSCTVCHQIRPDNFGQRSSFVGGFQIDTTRPAGERQIFGPYTIDAGHQRIMHSATTFLPQEATHVKDSELCATCHTLYTKALDDTGAEISEFPEQMVYLEWAASGYRGTQSCQDCHMPKLKQDTAITSVLGQPRSEFAQHTFIGANAFMLRILNKYRNELGVAALPQELDESSKATVDFLSTASARVAIDGAQVSGRTLSFNVGVTSLTGHKLPTAYPARRAWLHVTVRNGAGATIFESGAINPDGSIVGNDNDADPLRFETHYAEIADPQQVQIYEAIMVDQAGKPTTGLLHAIRYIKDNRLLPKGFDRANPNTDVAVQGSAKTDDNFVGGGDRIRYRVALGEARGPLSVSAELMYQSVSYRWAHNLDPYDAMEPQRFTRYYRETAEHSSMTLAADAATIQLP